MSGGSWAVEVERHVLKQLQQLPRTAFAAVLHQLLELPGGPFPAGVVKLTGSKDVWRVRCGDYRILYRVDERGRRITVIEVGHRGEVYH